MMKRTNIAATGMVLLALLLLAGCPDTTSGGGGGGTSGGDAFSTPAEYRAMVSIGAGSVTESADNGGGVFIADRTVTLRAFKLATYETTYELWKEVYDWARADARGEKQYVFANAGVEGHGTTGTGTAEAAVKKTRPVTMVNWRDAVVWCNAYSEMSGKAPVYYTDSTVLRTSTNDSGTATAADGAVVKAGANGFRLPTEAEWEYAARGGNRANATNWGYTFAGAGSSTSDTTALNSVAWWRGNSYDLGSSSADWGAHPVGTKDGSAGLYDMTGNVWEWCWDWYGTVNAATDPAGPASGANRVVRGGSWSSNAVLSAVAYRHGFIPNYRYGNLGFRVLCP